MSPIVAPRVIFWQNLQKRTGQLRLVTEILSVNFYDATIDANLA